MGYFLLTESLVSPEIIMLRSGSVGRQERAMTPFNGLWRSRRAPSARSTPQDAGRQNRPFAVVMGPTVNAGRPG